jgi:hypothetical protein
MAHVNFPVSFIVLKTHIHSFIQSFIHLHTTLYNHKIDAWGNVRCICLLCKPRIYYSVHKNPLNPFHTIFILLPSTFRSMKHSHNVCFIHPSIHLSIGLTPRSRAHFFKLIFTQLFKNSPEFYWTWKFIPVFTTTCDLTVSWDKLILAAQGLPSVTSISTFKKLRSTHSVRICVLCGSHNQQWLGPIHHNVTGFYSEMECVYCAVKFIVERFT